MPREITDADLDFLSGFIKDGDLEGYYNQLQEWGYPYGDLAAGVVTGDTFSGRFANAHLVDQAQTNGIYVTERLAEKINDALVAEDFQARYDSDSPVRRSEALSVDTIEDFHHNVFDRFGIPPDERPHASGPCRVLVHNGPAVHLDDGFWCRWAVSESAMGPLCVVVSAPLFDDDLGLSKGVEDL